MSNKIIEHEDTGITEYISYIRNPNMTKIYGDKEIELVVEDAKGNAFAEQVAKQVIRTMRDANRRFEIYLKDIK